MNRQRDETRRKQELASKVKDIKQRQQLWLEEKKRQEANGDVLTVEEQSEKESQKSPVRKILEKNRNSHSTNSPSYNTDTADHEDNQSYEDRADRIISRVRNVLSFNAKEAVIKSLDGSVLTGHLCCKCNELMIGPHHSPMMLIPCGHNLCNHCARKSKTCYLCDTPIRNLTCNITLKQIITNSNTRGQAEYSPAAYQNVSREDEESAELQSLQVRREAMQEELETIQSNLSQIKRAIQDENQRIISLDESVSEAHKQMRLLEARISSLRDQQQEAKQRIAHHENSIAAEHKKAQLIHETMSYLDSKAKELQRGKS